MFADTVARTEGAVCRTLALGVHGVCQGNATVLQALADAEKTFRIVKSGPTDDLTVHMDETGALVTVIPADSERCVVFVDCCHVLACTITGIADCLCITIYS